MMSSMRTVRAPAPPLAGSAGTSDAVIETDRLTKRAVLVVAGALLAVAGGIGATLRDVTG